MAMRRVFQPMQRLLGWPCRPATLHVQAGPLGSPSSSSYMSGDAEEKKHQAKGDSSKSGQGATPEEGEQVVASWSEDKASYSEAVVRETARARRDASAGSQLRSERRVMRVAYFPLRFTRQAHITQVKAERCEADSAIVKTEDGRTVFVSQEVCTVRCAPTRSGITRQRELTFPRVVTCSLDNQNHAKERLQQATIKRLRAKEAREECQPA